MSQPAGRAATPGPTSDRTRVLRLVLWSFLFWTALGLFFATLLHFAGLAWLVAIEWSLPRWYTWGLLTPAIFWLDRWLIDRLALGWRLALHVPLAVAWTSFAILLRLAVRPLRGAPLPTDLAAFFVERFPPDILIYAVIAGVSLMRAYTGRVHERERQARDLAAGLERRLSEARLQNLRAQLQPHFLFNALNTISAFTESDPPLARRLMAQLGDLLRASLAHTSQPVVTLGEELTFLDDYLAIESARFEDRITVDVSADEHAVDLPVPSFLLQPLVENAIRHGVAPRLAGGRIEVSATRAGPTLNLRVRDNGLGLPKDWNIEQHAGVGLSNLRSRLQHLYGRDDLLRVDAVASGGVDVQVTIPGAPSSGLASASDRVIPGRA